MSPAPVPPHPALTGPPVASVAGAVARMEAIAAALPGADGVACFNRMYLKVTREVGERLEDGYFEDAVFMDRLDVVFANLYLDAVRASVLDPGRVPRAWDALVERRDAAGVAPIQFALAGMNAHINRDLPLAVVAACEALGVEPEGGSRRRDFERVDELLVAAEHEVRHEFLDDPDLPHPEHLHLLERVLAGFSLVHARAGAWCNAEALWELRRAAWLRDRFLSALDRLVGFAGRGLLTPVG